MQAQQAKHPPQKRRRAVQWKKKSRDTFTLTLTNEYFNLALLILERLQLKNLSG